MSSVEKLLTKLNQVIVNCGDCSLEMFTCKKNTACPFRNKIKLLNTIPE